MNGVQPRRLPPGGAPSSLAYPVAATSTASCERCLRLHEEPFLGMAVPEHTITTVPGCLWSARRPRPSVGRRSGVPGRAVARAAPPRATRTVRPASRSTRCERKHHRMIQALASVGEAKGCRVARAQRRPPAALVPAPPRRAAASQPLISLIFPLTHHLLPLSSPNGNASPRFAHVHRCGARAPCREGLWVVHPSHPSVSVLSLIHI